MRWPTALFCGLSVLAPLAAQADSLVATRVIRAQSVIAAEDVTLVAADLPGALADPAAAIGQEARVSIYPGHAVRGADLGRAATVERNQILPLAYRTGALEIVTEGRALGRGGPGDVIEALNLASRSRVTGVIGPDGVLVVGQLP
jgi:flagella basal body P-ring formation protein FlgA